MKTGLLIFLIVNAYMNNRDVLEENLNCVYYTVTAEKLNVRDSANYDSNIVGKVEKPNRLCIDNLEGEWAHIKNSNWVNVKYLNKQDRNIVDEYIGPVLIAPIIIFFVITQLSHIKPSSFLV
ncbi:hypothetical protein [Sulfurimonas sp.]|uniref:hypothetical protein n=1 Tax=Sulfurimonas sp. TaxID=2022749 RepID=UPI0025F6CA16|nr:hypothetical protein [Sulfurimonas sp.]MBW6489494.1 hypothetical protein [Sulfurimonas sp.]